MSNVVIEKRDDKDKAVLDISFKKPVVLERKSEPGSRNFLLSPESNINLLGILTAFVENSSAVILIKNRDGKYLLANQNFADLLGVSPQDILGKSDRDFFPAEFVEQVHRNMRKVIEQNRPIHFEEEVEMGDGTRYFHTIRFPVRFSERYPDAVGCILIEVTDKKRTEERLETTKTALITEQVTLRKKNIALKELINQIESEKKQIKRRIKANIENIISPLIENLKQKADRNCVDQINLLESSLKDVAAPFISDLEKSDPRMSPRETEICNMIKNGLNSKDIARLLGISAQTVIKQRKHIRKKLGISNRRVNLTSYLKSL